MRITTGKEKTCTNAYSIFQFENTADNHSLCLTLAREQFSHNRNNTDTQDIKKGDRGGQWAIIKTNTKSRNRTQEKPLRMKAHPNPFNMESFEISGSVCSRQSERQYLCVLAVYQHHRIF